MQHVFIVTEYGCNSTPGDMWIPHSELFTDYTEAYQYFSRLAPTSDDVTRYVNESYDPNSTDGKYTIIFDIHQGLTKRPYGVVIARYGIS
jgi:hypothetical protein